MESHVHVHAHPTGNKEEACKVRKVDMKYYCTYVPSQGGTYTVNVSYGGKTVRRSPFTVHVAQAITPGMSENLNENQNENENISFRATNIFTFSNLAASYVQVSASTCTCIYMYLRCLSMGPNSSFWTGSRRICEHTRSFHPGHWRTECRYRFSDRGPI